MRSTSPVASYVSSAWASTAIETRPRCAAPRWVGAPSASDAAGPPVQLRYRRRRLVAEPGRRRPTPGRPAPTASSARQRCSARSPPAARGPADSAPARRPRPAAATSPATRTLARLRARPPPDPRPAQAQHAGPGEQGHLRPEHPGLPGAAIAGGHRAVGELQAETAAQSRGQKRLQPLAVAPGVALLQQIGEVRPGEEVVRVRQPALAVHPEPEVEAHLPVGEEHVDPVVELLGRGVGRDRPASGATRRSSTPPPSWTAGGSGRTPRPVRRPPPPTPPDSTPPRAVPGPGRS